MKKNIIKYVCLMSVSFSLLATPILAKTVTSPVSVKYNQLLQPTKNDIINENGTLLIEARELANILNGKFTSSEIFNNVSIKIGDKEFVAYNNSTKATIGDKELKMPIQAKIINGKVYLPAKFVANAFGYDVKWDSAKKEMSIINKNQDYIVLPKIYEMKDGISFNQALDMAIKNNSNLKNLNDTYEYLKNVNKKINENLQKQDPANLAQNAFPLNGESGLTDPNSPEYIENSLALLRNIKSTESQLKNQEINKQIIKDTIELSLLSSVIAIKNTELNIVALKNTVAINEMNIKNLEAKENFGFTSKKDLTTAQNNNETIKKELKNAEQALINQKENLKSILGTEKDLDVDISLNFEYNEIEKIDLEAYIRKAIYSDLSIKILENEVSVAEYNLNTNAFSSSDNKEKFQNELNYAQRKLKDARVNLEKKIRNAYSNLVSFKNREQILKNNLQTAVNEYNATISNYKFGKATIYQVEMAKNAILSAEKALEENKLNFSSAIYTFYKPYLL